MRTMKRNICRLMLLGMLFFTCMMGMADTADAKTGTWKQDKKGWYYSYSDGTYAKNEWVKYSGKWYYFNASGYMQTGWKQIGGKWYYFKSNGVMAANEYCKGYWLNKDGTWTAKDKAQWKHGKQGWWFEDTGGWYAKDQWLMIDGKEYYFLESGYLAMNRWIGKYYVGSGGTWVKGKTPVDWAGLYQTFLADQTYRSQGQSFGPEEFTFGKLYDIDHDGIPELLIGSRKEADDYGNNEYNYVYTCASGKVEYVGAGGAGYWCSVKTKADPEGMLYLCYYSWDGSASKYRYIRYDMKGTSLTAKQISKLDSALPDQPQNFTQHIDCLKDELTACGKLTDLADPVTWMARLRVSLRETTTVTLSYDSEKATSFDVGSLAYFDSFPVDPKIYSPASTTMQYDPKNRFNGYYFQLDGKKMDWILRNVYNCSDSAVAATRKCDDGTSYSPYYQNGYYYTYPFGSVAEVNSEIVIEDVKQVNGLYKIKYSRRRYFYGGQFADSHQTYGVLELKKTGTKSFWSMYACGDTEKSDSEVKKIQKKKAEKLP